MTTVAINVRMKQLIALLWKQFKVWRRLQLGPIALRFKFERSVRTTGGTAAVQGDSESRRAVHISERGFAQLQASPAAISGSSRSTARDLAVIVGVGPGFGYALARSVVAEGFDVVLISRNAERLDPLVADLRTSGRAITSYGGDATEEGTVESLFRKIAELHGVPTLVVYSIQEFGPGMAIDVEFPDGQIEVPRASLHGRR